MYAATTRDQAGQFYFSRKTSQQPDCSHIRIHQTLGSRRPALKHQATRNHQVLKLNFGPFASFSPRCDSTGRHSFPRAPLTARTASAEADPAPMQAQPLAAGSAGMANTSAPSVNEALLIENVKLIASLVELQEHRYKPLAMPGPAERECASTLQDQLIYLLEQANINYPPHVVKRAFQQLELQHIFADYCGSLPNNRLYSVNTNLPDISPDSCVRPSKTATR